MKPFDPGTIYDKTNPTLASVVRKQRKLLGALARLCFTSGTPQGFIDQAKEEYATYTLEIDEYVKSKAKPETP
jgi:hypothetical protein